MDVPSKTIGRAGGGNRAGGTVVPKRAAGPLRRSGRETRSTRGTNSISVGSTHFIMPGAIADSSSDRWLLIR